MNNIILSFQQLRSYCESEEFKGWDPYDGLNSKLFQILPLFKNIAFFRLLVIQGFKKLPLNLRQIGMIPKGYNSKGIALFLQAYCNLYKSLINNSQMDKIVGSKEDIYKIIIKLAELLISLQSKGYHGSCWGYNFDWQSKAFFLPKYTPTVVATSFAVEALFSAYEVTRKSIYYSVAVNSANFIIKDLNRIEKPKGFMFSYSPLDKRAVYNATLLGSKTLALLYNYTRIEDYKELAKLSVLAVCEEQNANGSFPHSDQVRNKWRDSFHTGFKLESLAFYQKYCDDFLFKTNMERGYEYWITHFFDKNTGIARYYDNSVYPIDLHCVAQMLSTLYKCQKIKSQEILVKQTINWAINNMQNKKRGYFYFQKNKKNINKNVYMRWPNAWMFYGLSYWLLYESENDKMY